MYLRRPEKMTATVAFLIAMNALSLGGCSQPKAGAANEKKCDCPEEEQSAVAPVSEQKKTEEKPVKETEQSSANHEAAILELFSLLEMEKMMRDSRSLLLDSFSQGNPQLAQFRDVQEEFLEKTIGWGALKDDFVKLYRDSFSQREVEELVAFYRTPLGKKVTTKLPALMQQGSALAQQKVMAKMPELTEALQKRAAEITEVAPAATPPARPSPAPLVSKSPQAPAPGE
jgi:hypothetical protein